MGPREPRDERGCAGEPLEQCRPGTALYGEIVEFLYREAELLDSNRFSDWLALFAEDIHYIMPVRTTQFLSGGAGFQEVCVLRR